MIKEREEKNTSATSFLIHVLTRSLIGLCRDSLLFRFVIGQRPPTTPRPKRKAVTNVFWNNNNNNKFLLEDTTETKHQETEINDESESASKDNSNNGDFCRLTSRLLDDEPRFTPRRERATKKRRQQSTIKKQTVVLMRSAKSPSWIQLKGHLRNVNDIILCR